jgi:hypothetical protein
MGGGVNVLQCWLLTGAIGRFLGWYHKSGSSEVCLKLCIEMGMHPHFSIPAWALDPATNYVQSLATYVKSNAPSWMVPYFEPGNEVWNTATTITTLVSYHAFQYRGNNFDWDNWYGKVLSTTGQDLAAIFGIGNLGTTYEVLCGYKLPVLQMRPSQAPLHIHA